jgi:ATP-dependent RNA helicase DeaD
MARGDEPLLLDKNRREVKNDDSWRDERPSRSDRGERPSRDRGEREERGARREHSPRVAEPGMQTYRIAVGHEHGVKPGNIVGAIANEANIESKFIGRIDIYDDYTILDLPDNLPADMLDHLKSVRVAGQSLRISAEKAGAAAAPAARPARAETRAEPRAERAPRIVDSAPGSRLNQVVDRLVLAKKTTNHVRRNRKRQGKSQHSYADLSYRSRQGGCRHASEYRRRDSQRSGLEAKYIGRIAIFDDHSTLDLPDGMPKELLQQLKDVWVAGKQIRISAVGSSSGGIAADFPSGPKRGGGDRRVAEKAHGKPGFKSANQANAVHPSSIKTAAPRVVSQLNKIVIVAI